MEMELEVCANLYFSTGKFLDVISFIFFCLAWIWWTSWCLSQLAPSFLTKAAPVRMADLFYSYYEVLCLPLATMKQMMDSQRTNSCTFTFRPLCLVAQSNTVVRRRNVPFEVCTWWPNMAWESCLIFQTAVSLDIPFEILSIFKTLEKLRNQNQNSNVTMVVFTINTSFVTKIYRHFWKYHPRMIQ